MRFTQLLVFISCLISSQLQAQPDNDFCLDAIRISDVTKYCSKNGAFNNIGATFDSTGNELSKPGCWNSARGDVWFRFISIASDVLITVNGNSLKTPQIALYSGSCGSQISEVACSEGLSNSNSSTIYKGGLSIGTSYLIRVNSEVGSFGTFQLCVNNYYPPKDQNGDCGTGAILCDKSSFHVQSVTGFGFIMDEADNTCLDLNNSDPVSNQSESNSTWFKWTAKTSGTLSFLIQPDIITDDIDFALFELTSLTDCSNKKLIRCIATGCQTTLSTERCLNQGCLGVTGLRDSEREFEENFNCDLGENGFAKSADLEQGKSYALVVNNYSSEGNGFFIEFGGSAQFLGPTAKFDVLPNSGLKCDQTFMIKDSSYFGNGIITKYSWNFGEGAFPSEVSFTKGPHEIQYKSFGKKTIVLVVESDKGCTFSSSIEIDVQPCCEDLTALKLITQKTDLICHGIRDGTITLGGIGGSPDYQFSINNSKLRRQLKYLSLDKGRYNIKIVDSKGCMDSSTLTLIEPPPTIVEAGPDVTVKLGHSITLNGSYSPTGLLKSIRWDPRDDINCDSCLNTTAIPTKSGEYKLEVVTNLGCIAFDSLNVVITLDGIVYIPNVFTPDRDSKNRIFRPFADRGVESIEFLRIFDRWGGLVYESKNLNITDESSGWDGTRNGQPLPSGVYVYVASLLFIDQVKRVVKGDITLIR